MAEHRRGALRSGAVRLEGAADSDSEPGPRQQGLAHQQVKHGDALLFDSLEPHCLTEAYYEPGTSAGARLWRAPLSLFTKKAHIKWGASKTDAAAGRLEPKTEAAAGRLEPDSRN